jgi:hypothetical protein
MGLFSSSKSSTPSTTDKVWKTRVACLRGAATESMLAMRDGRVPLIVTFFDEAHAALIDFLSRSGVPFAEVHGVSDIGDLEGKNTIGIWHAGTQGFPGGIHREIKASIFLLGHYPLAEAEDKVISSLGLHFPASKMSFCVSLEDPFFHAFGSDKIRSLMETLGMKDDEFIEHKLVNKAIRNAQEKIAARVIVEIRSRSEKEWFEKNALT